MIIEGYNDNVISNTTNKHSNDKHLDIAENTDNDFLTDKITHIPIENTRLQNNVLWCMGISDISCHFFKRKQLL